MTISPGISLARGQREAKRRLLLSGALSLALFILFGIGLYFSRPDRRHNIVQTGAALLFAFILMWQLLPLRRGFLPPGEDQAGEAAGSRKGLLWALVAGAVAYSSTLTFFFVSDDFAQLRKAGSPFFRTIWQYVTNGQLDTQGFHLFYRPLGFASLFLEYRIWHYWALGYHINNLIWHLLAVAGLFLFCEQLGLDKRACAGAALLFAIMPANVETVTWIGCRFDRLATTFMLWASFFYVAFRRSGRVSGYFLALLLFLLAAVCKETAYVLPIVWLALDLLVLEGPRLKPMAGYMAVAGLSFLYRLHALAGIGGYRLPNGAPAALHVTRAALAAVLIREPAEMLFGYNWLQPGAAALIIAAAGTAAIVFTLVIRGRKTQSSSRLVYFSLIWILASGLPAHFLFWKSDPGLTYSRVLYYGSAGLALLLAVLIAQAVHCEPWRHFWVGVLACLFAVALFHNLGAWRWNSELSHGFLAEFRELAPSPPAHSTFVIENLPLNIRGVPFIEIGLMEAVQYDYGNRRDLFTYRADELHQPQPAALRLRWTGNPARPLERLQE